MASPTPISDPVIAPPTPPVSDPIVASNRPKSPSWAMSLSRDNWSAWTGGKPAPGWVGLDPSAANDITSPNQLHPVHAFASQKGYNLGCCTGMTTLVTHASSLIDFQDTVWDQPPSRYGKDTVTYLPNPENSFKVTNVVKSHSR